MKDNESAVRVGAEDRPAPPVDEKRPLRVLAIGDRFIPSASYRQALHRRAEKDVISLSDLSWSGEKARQHELQQVMEVHGANSVPPPAEILGAIEAVDAVCLHFAPIGRDVLRAAPGLRLVAVARSGLENVDVETATKRGIGVVPAHGRNAGAVAELQIGLILAEARNISRADADVKAGGWRKDFPGARLEIHGRTVGMVGFGHVGRVFSERISGFAPDLIAFDPYVSDAALADAGVARAGSLIELFERSDFIVVQARLTPETQRMITRAHFAAMKPSAYFINVSRSRLVDTGALVDALRQGRIAGAGLDVYDAEPLAADDPLRTLDNVTLTTHFGGDTEDTNRISAELAIDAVAEYARTGRVRRAVNATALGWS